MRTWRRLENYKFYDLLIDFFIYIKSCNIVGLKMYLFFNYNFFFIILNIILIYLLNYFGSFCNVNFIIIIFFFFLLMIVIETPKKVITQSQKIFLNTMKIIPFCNELNRSVVLITLLWNSAPAIIKYLFNLWTHYIFF